MLFNRLEKLALLLFATLSVGVLVQAQSIDDNLTPISSNGCLQSCERHRDECGVSAAGDREAVNECERTVTTPCINACNRGEAFTPPPYPKPKPTCSEDTWICTEWSACSEAGAQTRSCTMTADCASAETPSPASSQTCTPPAPPKEPEPTPAPEPTPEPAPTPEPKRTQEPEPVKPAPTRTEPEPETAPDTEPDAIPEPQREPDPTPPPASEPTDATEPLQEEDAAPIPETGNPSPGGSAGGGSSVASRADIDCKAGGLTEQECRDLLIRGLGFEDCAAAGIVTRESCERYLSDRNGGTFPGCENAQPARCAAVKNVLLVRYIEEDAKDVADALLQSMIEREVVEPIDGLTSIGDERVKDAAWWRATGEGETSAGVVVIDSDRDGLPDDFERDLGLNPDSDDSDGDGIKDAEDLRRGEAPKDPTSQAIVNRLPLGQPHGDGETDDGLSATVGEGRKLYGFCDPNATCLIFVYSYVPTVFTVQSDANGEWSYDLGDQLSEGSHIAYVTVSDGDGSVDRKSSPLSFFVTEAQAVSADPNDYLGAAPIVAAQRQQDTTTTWYVLGTLGAMLAAGLAAFMVLRPKPSRARLP